MKQKINQNQQMDTLLYYRSALVTKCVATYSAKLTIMEHGGKPLSVAALQTRGLNQSSSYKTVGWNMEGPHALLLFRLKGDLQHEL